MQIRNLGKAVLSFSLALTLALAFIGMTGVAAPTPAKAQYYYPPPPPQPPPYYYGRPGPYGYPYRERGWRTWNGCPPHYTVQGGVCRPYRGF
jgi:hypothetical protein